MKYIVTLSLLIFLRTPSQAAFAGILTSGVVRATYLIHTNLLSSQFELARNREFVRIQVKGIIFFVSIQSNELLPLLSISRTDYTDFACRLLHLGYGSSTASPAMS